MTDQTRRAQVFRDLHRQRGLILPNAWDAASARVFQTSGFAAVATTSAGVAWARGARDGEALTRAEMMREIATIARALDLPLNADVEAGYGPTAADAAETARQAWAAGAVGVNFEDADYAAPGALTSVSHQQARIAAMRDAVPEIVINARTDVFLLGLGDSEVERVGMAIERGRAWLEAGADVVFLPGVTDPAVVKRLADGVGGPISLMAGPDAPPATALFAAGACRISTGPYPMRAILERLKSLADGLAADWSVMSPAGDGLTKIGVVFG
ncbi:carboxyvinyl-carboxyphosphonate phosphorylmutase [Brevundimonas intermedia]|uniref:Carboxyvinyl-carboxyphosphonate phosphorylmutase n=1 Tax=Brevundimonas intermedia TaxID=74315 RepID=A0ABQ5T7W6_9CAUL|nr:isocitrate lyase/phosphoenolpyruvate mutase family protein [Brevundimonas intermedia]GLK48240.1 carboxyvinyl-carboxyphosphonate phosphorylmutase [Brevundimonas intermedia]